VTASAPGRWRPTASVDGLRARADLLERIRAFFADRGVLEVETPLLSAATIPDPNIHSLSCRWRSPGDREGVTLYLQTSPEFAMKRLLAAGSGPIFQICKALRDGEAGRRHNPEFTLLEWYRPGWDHLRLMDEVQELLAATLGAAEGERVTYAEAFQRHAGLDPHSASDAELREAAARAGLADPAPLPRDDLLDLLLATVVEAELGRSGPTFLTHYPASQAALARLDAGDPRVAQRFEVFLDGIELANGFGELTDASEQRRRFERDLDERHRRGLPTVPMDERLLAALEAGLPSCSGVALGLDRLLMLALGVSDIADVLAFPIDRA